MSFEIATSDVKGVRLIEVSGRIDSISSDELHEALTEAIDGGVTRMVVDMADVEYMSSAGLRELVSALKIVSKMDGDLRLSNPSPRVMEVLELAGLDFIFRIFSSRGDALGSF